MSSTRYAMPPSQALYKKTPCPRFTVGETGKVKANFWRSLIAVVAGNVIYLAVERFLPPRGQHHLYRIDWGLAIDFWICLVCYGLLRFIR